MHLSCCFIKISYFAEFENLSLVSLFTLAFLDLFSHYLFSASVSGLEKKWNSSFPFGRAALKLSLTTGQVLLSFWLANEWPDPLHIGLVRMKRYLPSKKVYLSWGTGKHFCQALCLFVLIIP